LHLTITHDPDLALLLLAVGAIGIYREFCAPGRIAPGVIGSELALLGFASLAALPLSLPGLAPVLAGIGCFVLEARFVSRGLFTAMGAAALLFGSKTLLAPVDPAVQIHWITAVCVAIPFSLATSFFFSVAACARRNKIVVSRKTC
jgi:membrane-bound serine protease (ClpP class)